MLFTWSKILQFSSNIVSSEFCTIKELWMVYFLGVFSASFKNERITFCEG